MLKQTSLIKPILIGCFLFFSSQVVGQSKWDNYVGLYFTGDATMYYNGVSFLVGSDYAVKKGYRICFYGQYFSRDFGDHSFRSGSLAALLQRNFGKNKKLYLAAGVAFQRALEEDDLYTDTIDRAIFLPAFRVGHAIFFKKFILYPEINVTGPYSYSGGGGTTTEIFTLPSIGTRFQFRNGQKKN